MWPPSSCASSQPTVRSRWGRHRPWREWQAPRQTLERPRAGGPTRLIGPVGVEPGRGGDDRRHIPLRLHRLQDVAGRQRVGSERSGGELAEELGDVRGTSFPSEGGTARRSEHDQLTGEGNALDALLTQLLHSADDIVDGADRTSRWCHWPARPHTPEIGSHQPPGPHVGSSHLVAKGATLEVRNDGVRCQHHRAPCRCPRCRSGSRAFTSELLSSSPAADRRIGRSIGARRRAVMTSADTMGSHPRWSEHGSCHHCGWVETSSKADHRSARQLGVRPCRRFCDDVLIDPARHWPTRRLGPACWSPIVVTSPDRQMVQPRVDVR